MSEQLKALYELQSIDLQLAKNQRTRASLDKGTAKKLELDAARCEYETAEKLLQEATTELRDKELNLKTVEGKQKTFHDKLYAGKVTNPKELSSMEKEIEMLGRQKDKIEERILELMDIITERKPIVDAADKVVKDLELEIVAIIERARKNNAILVARIKEQLPKREQAAAAVEPILLKRYEAARVRQSGVVVSKIEGEDCSACHTKVGLGTLREVKLDNELVTCDNCGRILFWEV